MKKCVRFSSRSTESAMRSHEMQRSDWLRLSRWSRRDLRSLLASSSDVAVYQVVML